MANLKEVLREVRSKTDSVAVGFIDLVSGGFVDKITTETHPNEVLDAVAAVLAGWFGGKEVQDVEEMFAHARGVAYDPSKPSITSHMFQAGPMFHLALRLVSKPGFVVVVVTRGEPMINKTMAQLRLMMPKIETATF